MDEMRSWDLRKIVDYRESSEVGGKRKSRMKMKKLGALAAALAITAAAPASTAVAKITCTNPGGNAPSGQQGKCTGQALENLNPAGHAPPGQNA